MSGLLPERGVEFYIELQSNTQQFYVALLICSNWAYGVKETTGRVVKKGVEHTKGKDTIFLLQKKKILTVLCKYCKNFINSHKSI